MKEVIEFLKENPVQYLATIDLQNKPSICPFQFMFECDNKLWFYTHKEKEIYKYMKENKSIELCVCNSNNKWIRISGDVMFSDDKSIKEKMIENCSIVKSIFNNSDNPLFEIFYIENGKATIYDHNENSPKEYTL